MIEEGKELSWLQLIKQIGFKLLAGLFELIVYIIIVGIIGSVFGMWGDNDK